MNSNKKDRELTYFNHNSHNNPHTQYVSNCKYFALRPYEMIKDTYYNVLTLLLDDKTKNNNINNEFEIAFDVYDSCSNGVDIDDKWELFLKVGHGNPEVYTNHGAAMIKLKGKERRALVIVDREKIKKELRIDLNNGGHRIEEKEVEKIRINLYVKMNDDTRLVKKFLNSNMESKFIKIHDRNYAISEEDIKNKMTAEEVKFYSDKAAWVEKAKIIENENFANTPTTDPIYKDKVKWHANTIKCYDEQLEYCNTKIELSKDSNNLVEEKIFSRTDNGVIKYNSPVYNDGMRYIKLFELVNDFNINQYVNYQGAFEVYTSYSVEHKKEYKNKYIKFSISCSNTTGNDYEVGFHILDSMNINDDTLFVTRNDNGIVSVWLADCYPSKVKVVPLFNDDPQYRVFRLTDINNEFIKFLPEDPKIKSGEYFYSLSDK